MNLWGVLGLALACGGLGALCGAAAWWHDRTGQPTPARVWLLLALICLGGGLVLIIYR